MARKSGVEKTEGFNGTSFCNLLRRVHLKGLLEECVVKTDKETCSIQAVDMSNTVFVSSKEKIAGIKDFNVGLGKLSLLVNFLEEEQATQGTIKDGWLILKKKGHGTVKTLLLEKDQVPTAFNPENQKNPVQEIKKITNAELVMEKKSVENLLYYINLMNCNTVLFKVKGSTVCVSNNKDSEQQFDLRFGVCAGEKGKDEYITEVFGQYLSAVLRTLTWEGDGSTPSMRLGPGAPILISQNKDNHWALTPIVA